MKNPLDQISFLLGSGVSFPADFPSVGELTNLILSGNGIMRHTNGNYYFGKPLYAHAGIPDEYVPRITVFLNRLKIEIDLYYLYLNSRLTDYEDLYYVAAQVRDCELHEYDNPAVQPLIDKILPEIKPLLIGRNSEIRRKWELHELATEATNYIRDIVWHSLTKEPNRLDHLRCIRDACSDNAVSGVYIHTLNHDTILERYLSQNDIQVIDGFSAPQNDMRYWNPDVFENDTPKVRLLKLHGSVNWFRFRPHESDDWSDEKIAIPLEWDFWHSKDSKGRLQWPVDGRPMFLAGTFNKMLDYNSGVYSDLHYQFYRSLKRTPILIVSGYGFRDRGINTRIVDWVYASNRHRIIVIHPNQSALLRSARGSISNKWDNWLKTGRVNIIPKPIEETSWEEVSTYLANELESSPSS